jgi:tetratricopeptide (TPR) repeat protein
MMDLIRDLVSTCKPSKLTREERVQAQSLMRELRGRGFTIRELHVLVSGKIPEPTIKKWIRNMPITDALEHDNVIALLGDFAERGNELSDLENYKDAKEKLAGKISFEKCAKLVENLGSVGADITILYNLSEELARRGLLVPTIEMNIKLNKDLAERGLTPQIQQNILDVAEKFGDVETIFKALDEYGEINRLHTQRSIEEEKVSIAEEKEAESRRRKEALDNQALIQKTYIDIVKLLVADYSYDYDSIKNLHELAKKYGNPLQVMGAVNVYGDIANLKKEAETQSIDVVTKGHELEVVKGKIKEADAEFRKLTELNAEANQVLGKIKANEEQSMRLQTISRLLQEPRKTRCTVDEISRITIALLSGVAECSRANQDYPDSFMKIVKGDIELTITDLNLYMRVH